MEQFKAWFEAGQVRTVSCGELDASHIGEEHLLMGWVDGVRDIGSLVFIDLRDWRGVTQVVARREHDEAAFELAKSLHLEYVVAVKGMVAKRDGEANANLATGEIEIQALSLTILNSSESPPFVVEDDVKASEELRMKYRYLDLRRNKMQRNLRLRHKFSSTTRAALDRRGFVEIETPSLMRSTPEGSRDYVVPSRVQPGKFYALPQSPQILKQLLMVSSFDRYYQFVRCFRDEDLRANRQPEFTQIDIEMSFVRPDDIYELVEEMYSEAFSVAGRSLEAPFPRLTFAQAMARFGVDKPDMRFGLELGDVSEFAGASEFRILRQVVEAGGSVWGFSVPGYAPEFSRKKVDEVSKAAVELGAKGLVPVLWDPDGGFRGPLAKAMSAEALAQLMTRLGGEPGSAALLVADHEAAAAQTVLGQLRLRIGRDRDLIDRSTFRPLWVTDFPLLEWREADQRWGAKHHPFTAPNPEDLELLDTDPGKVRALAYDLVVDGEELGGGSMRIHRREVQERVFRAIGLSDEEAERNFGWFLRGLRYGAPPHGGIALGLERSVMTLLGEPSIRDVLAFPKTTTAQCLLTESPAGLDPAQLNELGLGLVGKAASSPPDGPEKS